MLKPISRRVFIKASAASAAILSLSSLDTKEWMEAKAESNEEAEIKKIPSTCNGCSSLCGMFVYTKNGRLWKLEGHPDHPRSKGKICARGHGFATIAYSPDRLTSPMKRKDDGNFEQITWDQAYQEIAEKMNKILNTNGPEAVSLIEDPRPTGKFYSKRFIQALGSANYYSHHVACSNGRDSGFIHSLGGVPSADVANSKYIMFIGRSYGDGIRPASMMALTKAKKEGAKVVIVDPRYNNTAPFADEWLAIRPGTDLALVLAMAHVLIKENIYDKQFITKYSVGFEEFKKSVEQYTPSWAEEITGISKDTIEKIAKEMASVKPQAVIEQSWRGAFGCNYANSTETGRIVALFNAMLGNIQQKGGHVFGIGAQVGKLDSTVHPEPPKVISKKQGEKEYPLAKKDSGVANIVPLRAKEGKMKACFFNHSNGAFSYGNPKYMQEALAHLDLIVTIDVQMSETALLSDYVLPEPSYIERDDVISVLSGSRPSVVMRQKTINKIHPDTVPQDQIFSEIAKAMGLGQYFNFTIDELNKAIIAPFGISIEEMREKGTIVLEEQVELGKVPTLKTPSGKVEFYSKAFKDAGFSPVVEWIPPLVSPTKDTFRLTTGKQAIHSHTQTTNIPYLMQITKDYSLERLWINRSVAESKGIKDNDLVEVRSDQAVSQVRAMVTDRLHPETVYIPSHYGITSKYLNTAKGIGFSYMEHVPFHFEAMSGHTMIHEVIVELRKVDA